MCYFFCSWKNKICNNRYKLYFKIVTLSTQDIAKLLEQLKYGFKRTTFWNKYQSKVSTERQNQYLNSLTDPIFQEVNRIVVLLFENECDGIVHTRYYHPKVEIKDYNVMINGQHFFDQPVKGDIRTDDSIQKITAGQEDDSTTDSTTNCNRFK